VGAHPDVVALDDGAGSKQAFEQAREQLAARVVASINVCMLRQSAYRSTISPGSRSASPCTRRRLAALGIRPDDVAQRDGLRQA